MRRSFALCLLVLAIATGATVPAVASDADLRSGTRAVDAHWCDTSTGSLASLKRTQHFAIWYDGAIDGGLTIDSYAAVLEHVWATEVMSFGWAAPPSFTSNPAPGGRYPVRIEPAESDYGFVSSSGAHAGTVGDNPSTGWNEGDAQASCMVLNEGFDTLGSSTNLDDLKVTAAHEFFHSISRGLGVTSDLDRSYREGGASWMEDEVYDSVDDNYQYLYPRWDQSMGAYPDSPTELAYGYWLVWRGLTEMYGTGVPGGAEDIMQRILTLVSKGTKQMPATEKAFAAERTVLGFAYHELAIAARFMQPCGGGYVQPFCFEEALLYTLSKSNNFPVHGTVRQTKGYAGSVRDDYALNWVKIPDRPKDYPIRVKNLSAGTPMFFSVACDLGTELRWDIWGILEPGKTGELGVDRRGCTGSSYVTVTSARRSAPNPTSSPMAAYKVWVPYSPITGTLSWTVTGSRSGTEGNIQWQESWTENGTVAIAVKRDPVNFANYLVVDNGSTYTIDYTFGRTDVNTFSGCTTTYDGAGVGSGTPVVPVGFIGSTYPNLDPPDPADDYPDVFGFAFTAPLSYAEDWTNDCGGTGTTNTDGAGPYYHGLFGATPPLCLPPAIAGISQEYKYGTFIGAWAETQQRFEFSCSKTVPMEGGSQTVTVSGTASYPSPP